MKVLTIKDQGGSVISRTEWKDEEAGGRGPMAALRMRWMRGYKGLRTWTLEDKDAEQEAAVAARLRTPVDGQRGPGSRSNARPDVTAYRKAMREWAAIHMPAEVKQRAGGGYFHSKTLREAYAAVAGPEPGTEVVNQPA